jgi:hypothetical protein
MVTRQETQMHVGASKYERREMAKQQEIQMQLTETRLLRFAVGTIYFLHLFLHCAK